MTRFIAPLFLITLAACSDAPPPAADATGLEETYWMAAPTAETTDVVAARALGEGAVHVIGRVADFVEGRAQFQLVDLKEEACPPDEGCPTPWDYCCLAPEELSASTIFVEFLDDGKPRAIGLEGFHGFTHLKEVVVHGSLHTDEQGNVTLAATGIHVKA